MLLLEILCVVLALMLLIAVTKIFLLHKSINEVRTQMKEKQEQETNTLLSVSTEDRYFRRFTAELNQQLRILRTERRKYQSGNAKLKKAVTNISHDLRTPLTAMKGYLELMKKEAQSEEMRRYVAIVENRTNALEQLTEELFRYSIVTSTEDNLLLEEICLNSVLEESILAYYAALTERGIAPDIFIPEEKVIRNLDKQALARIFANVIHNALKYSDGDLKISLLENGTIIFNNAAATLNETEVRKLFDRFYTVETARNSTGIGLSIAKTLVEQMHGTIDAKYEKNRLWIKIRFPDCW